MARPQTSKALAVTLAVLTSLPAGTVAGAAGSATADPTPDPTGPVQVASETRVDLSCPEGVLELVGGLADGPSDQFVVVRVTNATGPVVVDGVRLADATPDVPLHLMLKASERTRRVVADCQPGATAEVSVLDAPIVEPLELPAQIVAGTYTRQGLRAVGLDNHLTVRMVPPTTRNVTVDLEAEGAPAPSTLVALGEDPRDEANRSRETLRRIAEDDQLATRLAATLLRVATLCSGQPPGGPPQDTARWLVQALQDRPEACAADNVGRVLARYDVPARYAQDLLTRLEQDPRCSIQNTTRFLSGLDLFQVSPDTAFPCLDLVGEWLDDTLAAEGLPPLGGLRDRVFRALGVRDDARSAPIASLLGLPRVQGGPCGDPRPESLGRLEQATSAAHNRTRPQRQEDCAELLVASLRPIRYTWTETDLTRRMGSTFYGSTRLSLGVDHAGETRLTLATQGPAVVDLTVDQEDRSLDDVAEPTRRPLDYVLNESGIDSPIPPAASNLTRVPLGPGAPESATAATADAYNDTVGPAAAALLADLVPTGCRSRVDRTPPSTNCTLDPAGGDGEREGLPTGSRGSDTVTVFSTSPPEEPPKAPARPYTGAPTDVVEAFTSKPGIPLAHADDHETPVLGPALELLGRNEVRIFVPTRLEVRFGPPPGPQAPDEVEHLRAFAAQRISELAHVADAGSLDPTEWGAKLPVELMLTGVTYRSVEEDGEFRIERQNHTHRLANLREGVTRNDLDLDGLVDGDETLHAVPRGSELFSHRLDPADPDTDGDGIPDGIEALQCQPRFRCTGGLAPWAPDGDRDADKDFLSNRAEFQRSWARIADTDCADRLRWACLADRLEARQADGCRGPDVLEAWAPDGDSVDGDCDGFPDGWETRFGFGPLEPRSPAPSANPDGDALNASQEADAYREAVQDYDVHEGMTREEARLEAAKPGPGGMLVSPTRPDTDGDGLPDGFELAWGYWPDEAPQRRTELPRRLAPLSPDADQDPDGDGLTTLEEFQATIAILGSRNPSMSRTDLLETATREALNPFAADTDGDGLDDQLELEGLRAGEPCSHPLEPQLDCDGDGLDDRVERWIAGDNQTATADERGEELYDCVLAPGDLETPELMNATRRDSDGDGIRDGYECWYGLDPTDPSDNDRDPDGDGLTSAAEFAETVRLHGDDGEPPEAFEPNGSTPARVLVPTTRGPWGDARATDRDADALPDAYELAVGLDPFVGGAEPTRPTPTNDPDRDGLAAFEEFTDAGSNEDSPSETLERALENGTRDAELLELLRETEPHPVDPDSDGDGMADGYEVRVGLDPGDPRDADRDPDGDGASNRAEHAFTAGKHARAIELRGPRVLANPDTPVLDPRDPDRDADGLSDGREIRLHDRQGCLPGDTYETGASGPSGFAHCFDPFDARDADDDFDGDTLSNREEIDGWNVTVVTHKVTDPQGQDRNRTVTRHATPNPLAWSTSDDGLSDAEQAPRDREGCPNPASLDPASADTDDDGVTDRVEVWEWTAVRGLPRDIDGDCHVNAADHDSDGDSYLWANTSLVDLSDGEEIRLKVTDSTRTDTDGDWAPDGREIAEWRAQDINPLNATTDLDGDGTLPLRDPSSEGDALPDGYEFAMGGSEALVNRSDDHDLDDDGLTDLCEYRLTAGEDPQGACPSADHDHEGSSHDQATRDASSNGGLEGGNHGEEELVEAQKAEAIPDDCVNYVEFDCDEDGIDDRFEYVHDDEGPGQELEGCNPGVWGKIADQHRGIAPHATRDGPDACLSHYIETVSSLKSHIAEAAYLENASRGPRVDSVRFGMDLSFDAVSAPCFYHRTCRAGIQPDGDTKLEFEVTVRDPDCNLDHAWVILQDRHLVRPNGTVETRDWGALDREQLPEETPSFEAIKPHHETCKDPPPGGVPNAYTFTVQFPAEAVGANLASLSFNGDLAPWIVAEDVDGHVAADFNSSVDIARNDVGAFASANNRLEEQLIQDARDLGKSMLEAVDTYLSRMRDKSRMTGDTDAGTALRLIDEGIGDFRRNLQFFGSYDYILEHCKDRYEDDKDEEYQGNQEQCAWTYGRGRDHARDILKGRVRVVAGIGAMEDLSRPASEAYKVALEILFRSGMSQREVSQLARDELGSLVDDPEATPDGGLPMLDWFFPAEKGEDSASAGCVTSHRLVQQLQGATPSGYDPPGASPAPDAIRFYDAATDRFMPAAPEPVWNYSCLSAATLAADASPGLAQSATMMLMPVEVVSTVLEGKKAIAAEIAWSLVEVAAEEAGNEPLALVACLGSSATSLMLGIASGGVGVAVTGPLAVFDVALCFEDFEEAGEEPSRPVQDVQGNDGGLSHNVFHAIQRFPATRTADRPPDDQPLLEVRVGTDVLDAIQRCVERSTTADDATVTDAGIGYLVRVDRFAVDATGSTWAPETVLRASVDLPMDETGSRADAVVPDGFSWQVERLRVDRSDPPIPLSTSHTFRYQGPPEPGLRRVTITTMPAWELDLDGTDRSTLRISDAGQPDLMPDAELEPKPETFAPVSLGEVPDRVRPIERFRGVLDAPGECMAPRFTSTTLVTGIGPPIPDRALAEAEIVAEDDGPDSLTRSLSMAGVDPGEVHRVYWDFGDADETATVAEAPDEPVSHRFSEPGRYEVIATAVDDAFRPIAQARGTIRAEDAEAQGRLDVRRNDELLVLEANVTDPDDCLTTVLRVTPADGTTQEWERIPACEDPSEGTHHNFTVERSVDAESLPPGSQATLVALEDGRTVVEETADVSGPPDTRLLEEPLEGFFNGGYEETDRFTYYASPPDGATSLASLSFCLRADSRVRLTVMGPFDGVPTNPDPQRLTLRGTGTLDVPETPEGGFEGTKWTVAVASNTARGTYTLSTNALGCTDTTDPPEDCYRSAGDVGCSREPPLDPTQPDRRLSFSEGFESPLTDTLLPPLGSDGDASIATRSLEGPGAWTRSSHTASTGDWSMHVGRPGDHPAYPDDSETDVLAVSLPARDVPASAPMELTFDELLDLDVDDPQAQRTVAVGCVGTAGSDGTGPRIVREVAHRTATGPTRGADEILDLRVRDHADWRSRTIPFTCGLSGVGTLEEIRLTFTFTSSENDGPDDPSASSRIRAANALCRLLNIQDACDFTRALGWFVDDVRVRER